jgi:hypothetical protein
MSPAGSLVANQPSLLHSPLTRLIEVVEEENAILRGMTVTVHAGYTDRKNHALRELMTAQRSETSQAAIELLRPMLQRLEVALAENAALLKLHIAAVGEMSDIIIGSLRESESDGTYSRRDRISRVNHSC